MLRENSADAHQKTLECGRRAVTLSVSSAGDPRVARQLLTIQLDPPALESGKDDDVATQVDHVYADQGDRRQWWRRRSTAGVARRRRRKPGVRSEEGDVGSRVSERASESCLRVSDACSRGYRLSSIARALERVSGLSPCLSRLL